MESAGQGCDFVEKSFPEAAGTILYCWINKRRIRISLDEEIGLGA
jgi:hypothetical protein